MANGVGIIDEFLLTRLLRGVTFGQSIINNFNPISTHTPLARRDDVLDDRAPFL